MTAEQKKQIENELVGKTIKIIEMIGEPQYTGKIGTVEFVDDIGQLHGNWGGCAVVYGLDKYKVLE